MPIALALTFGATQPRRSGGSAPGFVTGAAAVGDFDVTIPPTKGVASVNMPANGWVIRIATNLGRVDSVDPSKLTMSVLDPGWNTDGTPANHPRTITGTARLYKPNGGAGAFTDADQPEGTVEIALDQQLYCPGGVTANGSKIVAITLGAGFINGSSPALTVPGSLVARADSADYPLPIPATVNWIGQRMDASNTLDVEYAVAHEHAQKGQQVACVEAWARVGGVDGPVGRASSMVDSIWTADGLAPSGLHQPVFRVPVPGGSLPDGEGGVRCTIKPWIGPAMNSFDPGVGDTWPSMNFLAELPFVKDVAGKYAPVYVWVNYDGTGLTGSSQAGVSTSATDPGAALSYTTILQAILAAQAWGATNRGHNTCAGVVVMFRDVEGSVAGAHLGAYSVRQNFRGSGINRGPLPMELRGAAGVTSERCRLRGWNTDGTASAGKEAFAFMILRNIYEDSQKTDQGSGNVIYHSGIDAPTLTMPTASEVVYWVKIDCKTVSNGLNPTWGINRDKYSVGNTYRGDTTPASGNGTFTEFSGTILRIGERMEGSGRTNPGVALACLGLGMGIGNQPYTNPAVPTVKFQLYYNCHFHYSISSGQAANLMEIDGRTQSSLGLGMVGCLWRRYGANMGGPFIRLGGDGRRQEFRNVVVQHVSTDAGASPGAARFNMFYNDQGWNQIRKDGSFRFSALASSATKDGWFGAPETPATDATVHNSATAYYRGKIVYTGASATTGDIYEAIRDVPVGVLITDASYWDARGPVGTVGFGNQPRRDGNDRFRYGVNSFGNVNGGSVQGGASDNNPTYNNSWLSTIRWPGSGTKWGEALPADYYVRSTGGSAGTLADLGDYRPNPAGPLIGMVPNGMAVDPFDALGKPRPNNGTGAAGALERGDPPPATPKPPLLLKKAGQVSGASATMAMVTDQAALAGDFLLVVATGAANQQLTAISDTAGNAYALLHGGDVSTHRVRVFGVQNAATLASGQTITCTFLAANGLKLAFAYAISGIASEDVAARASVNGVASTVVSLTTPALAQANNKVIAHLTVIGGNADASPAVGAPFVLVDSHTQQSLSSYVYVVDTSSASAVTFAASLAVERSWSLVLTTLKAV